MKITLNQEEIHQAVDAFVRSQITIAANQEVSIDFSMTRGENGLIASLDIRAMMPVAPEPVPMSVTAPRNAAAATRPTSVRSSPLPAELRALPDASSALANDIISEAIAAADEAEADAVEAAEQTTLQEEIRPVPTETVKKSSIFSKASAEPKAAEPTEEAQPRPAGKSIFSRAEG